MGAKKKKEIAYLVVTTRDEIENNYYKSMKTTEFVFE